MPGLMAIIGADSTPMKRELQAVQRMARDAGVNIQRGISGGSSGGHGGQSGVIRESVVLLREISRGNWTRVPGSVSILLQRMGILNLILKDGAGASRILADAWQRQAEVASLAAVAAVRKAAASQAALYAEEGEAEATLAAAVADEEKAASAILAAKATQAKAVASAEAAAADTSAAVVGVGAVGIIGAAIAGVAIAAGLWWYRVKLITESLSGLKVPDFSPSYIAKHLQAVNAAAEGQKEINREVLKTVELYNSAAEAAKRVDETTKAHFDHLRKMNEYEKDPRKQERNELRIGDQEREQDLENKKAERDVLAFEADKKKAAADAINVTSKEQDAENVKRTEGLAKEAEAFIKGRGEFGASPIWDSFKANLTGAIGPGAAQASLNDSKEAEAKRVSEAQARIDSNKDAIDNAAANDVLRKRKEELTKESEAAAKRATQLDLSLPELQRRADESSRNAELESAAKMRANQKNEHGTVNSLQRIGGYNIQGSLETIARRQLGHLASIDRQLTHLNSPGFTHTRH